MTEVLSKPCAAFAGTRLIARGPLSEVALAAKAVDGTEEGSILFFDEEAGEVIDLDLRGDPQEVLRRLAERGVGEAAEDRPKQGRGRPKLGVVAREVTLLPRHWDWLSAQSGGASQALRRLVDQARRADRGETEARARREAAFRFMSAMAGDLPGYEEAIRALFADDPSRLAEHTAPWPDDVRAYALELAFGRDGR